MFANLVVAVVVTNLVSTVVIEDFVSLLRPIYPYLQTFLSLHPPSHILERMQPIFASSSIFLTCFLVYLESM